MQVINAAELFNSMEHIDSLEFEHSGNINIDFSNIGYIDLKAINALLNIQKVAILNNKKLIASNVNPKVSQMLEVTGLSKTFSKNTTNPIKV